MRYGPHEILVASARGRRAGAGWTVLGCLIILSTVILLTQLTYDMGLSVLSGGGARDAAVDTLVSGSTPGAMLILLFSFAAWVIAVGLALVLAHGRRLMDAIGADAVPQFRAVLGAVVLLNVVLLLLPPWTLGSATEPGLPFGRWATLLPVALLGVLIQVGAEELVFRGYLQQQLAARFRAPVIWMGVPSALFAPAHYDPVMGRNAWIVVAWAGVFGLLMADLTARSGSLGPAIAVHFVNNAIAMLLISPPDMLSGLALRVLPFPITDEAAVSGLLLVDLGVMLVSWLAARVVLRR